MQRKQEMEKMEEEALKNFGSDTPLKVKLVKYLYSYYINIFISETYAMINIPCSKNCKRIKYLVFPHLHLLVSQACMLTRKV